MDLNLQLSMRGRIQPQDQHGFGLACGLGRQAQLSRKYLLARFFAIIDEPEQETSWIAGAGGPFLSCSALAASAEAAHPVWTSAVSAP
jgi:hypothetical protein